MGEGEKGSVSRYVLGWVFGALVLVMVFVIFGGGGEYLIVSRTGSRVLPMAKGSSLGFVVHFDEGLVLIPSSFPDSPAEVPAVVFQSRRC